MATLSKYQIDNNLTQRKLADLLGLSKSYVNEILRGTKAPSLETALSINAKTGGAVDLASLIKVANRQAPDTQKAAAE